MKRKQSDYITNRHVLTRSSAPLFAAGAAWVVYALFFPLYRAGDVLICAAVSALVYMLVVAVIPYRLYLDPEREQRVVEKTGDADADELLLRLRGFAAAFEGNPYAGRLAALTVQLYEAVRVNPAQARLLRRAADYYLPTARKLLAARAEHGEISPRIDRAVCGVAEALEHMLAQLRADEALDLETDMDVLQQVLAGEGLTDVAARREG